MQSDPNTPNWLSDSNVPIANDNGGLQTVTIAGPPSASVSASAAAASSTPTATDEGDNKDLPGIILMMRLANMIAAGTLIACSILLMTTIPVPSAFVLAVYATCGGLLICCLETQLKFLRVMIAVNFGFLFNSTWRFLFYLLLASMAWSFNNLFGKVVALAFIGVAFFNTYVLCRYPTYRKMREKIAQEEDKRIEARISKEVKAQAARSISGK